MGGSVPPHAYEQFTHPHRDAAGLPAKSHQDALILGLMEQLKHQHEVILQYIGAAPPALVQNG